ncbi:MAG: M24 family metallopeptidase, partial [Singulisphaera sp.]
TGDDSTFLLTPTRALVISDGRYTTQLQQECPDLEIHIRPVGQPMNGGIAEVVEKLGIRQLAFEGSAVSVADFEAWKEKMPSASFVAVHHRVEALRMLKDKGEIVAIRQAVDFAERAFAMLRAGLRPEETEKDTADALEGYLRRCGASAASFPPIVAVGVRSALPHARPTATTRIGDDDFVLVDWGATGSPYKSDLTRVLVPGGSPLGSRSIGPSRGRNEESPRSARRRRATSTPKPAPSSRRPVSAVSSTTAWAMGSAWISTRPPAPQGVRRHAPTRHGRHRRARHLPPRLGSPDRRRHPGTPDGSEVLTHLPKSLDQVRPRGDRRGRLTTARRSRPGSPSLEAPPFGQMRSARNAGE